MLIIQKYGGTSLLNNERMLAAAKRIAQAREQGSQVVAVVSAQGYTTDTLAREISNLQPGKFVRETDAFLAAGEQMSAAKMAMTLQSLGVDAVSLTGFQAGIFTDAAHGDARITHVETGRIIDELERGRVVVVAGFQGIDRVGDITTLGRGGSDTTAVALAAYLKADLCQIFTDVDGVYDRDPRKFADAVRFDRICYDAMLALAQNGAQVLHDRCIELAKEHQVTIRVLSSFSPGAGTVVAGEN